MVNAMHSGRSGSPGNWNIFFKRITHMRISIMLKSQ